MSSAPDKPSKTRGPEAQGRAVTPRGSIWWRLDGLRHRDGARTPLIVIHGGPGGSHEYLLSLANLASKRSVLFYDQLDCGRSDRPMDPQNWRIDRFADEIDAVAEAAGLDQFALLGHSWGGAIATEYAARRPANLRGLVLFSALISVKSWVKDNLRLLQELPEANRRIIERGERSDSADDPDFEKALSEFLQLHFNRQPNTPRELVRLQRTMNVGLYNAMWGDARFSTSGPLAGHDAARLLPRIAVPTLFLCGEHDQSTPETNRRFASLVRGAKCVVIEGASHTAHFEQPARFLSAMRAFMGRLDSRQTALDLDG